MFCGARLDKKIIIERQSDHKKIKTYNIGLFKHYEDGRIIAVCRLCYRVSFSKGSKSHDVPDGWKKIDINKGRSPSKKVRIEKIYNDLKRDLKNDKRVKAENERRDKERTD